MSHTTLDNLIMHKPLFKSRFCFIILNVLYVVREAPRILVYVTCFTKMKVGHWNFKIKVGKIKVFVTPSQVKILQK